MTTQAELDTCLPRREPMGPLVTTSVSAEDYAHLTGIARQHDRPVSWALRRALKYYLNHLATVEADGIPESRGIISRTSTTFRLPVDDYNRFTLLARKHDRIFGREARRAVLYYIHHYPDVEQELASEIQNTAKSGTGEGR